MSTKVRLKGRLKKQVESLDVISVFQVWDNISDEEIAELEGLYRVSYLENYSANKFNKQQSYGPYRKLPEVFKE